MELYHSDEEILEDQDASPTPRVSENKSGGMSVECDITSNEGSMELDDGAEGTGMINSTSISDAPEYHDIGDDTAENTEMAHELHPGPHASPTRSHVGFMTDNSEHHDHRHHNANPLDRHSLSYTGSEPSSRNGSSARVEDRDSRSPSLGSDSRMEYADDRTPSHHSNEVESEEEDDTQGQSSLRSDISKVLESEEDDTGFVLSATVHNKQHSQNSDASPLRDLQSIPPPHAFDPSSAYGSQDGSDESASPPSSPSPPSRQQDSRQGQKRFVIPQELRKPASSVTFEKPANYQQALRTQNDIGPADEIDTSLRRPARGYDVTPRVESESEHEGEDDTRPQASLDSSKEQSVLPEVRGS